MAKKQTTQTAVAAATPVAAVATPVAAVAAAATPVALFTYAASGAAFARNEAGRSRLLQELGEHLKTCDYAQWTAAAKEWQDGAAAAGYAAPAKLWTRTVEAAQTLGFCGDKPASSSASADKKAAQRTAKVDKLAAVKAGQTPAGLVAKAGEAIKAGKAGEAADMLRAAKELQSDADKAAKAKAKAATEKPVQELRAAIARLATAGNAAALKQLLTVALKLSPAPKKTAKA